MSCSWRDIQDRGRYQGRPDLDAWQRDRAAEPRTSAHPIGGSRSIVALFGQSRRRAHPADAQHRREGPRGQVGADNALATRAETPNQDSEPRGGGSVGVSRVGEGRPRSQAHAHRPASRLDSEIAGPGGSEFRPRSSDPVHAESKLGLRGQEVGSGSRRLCRGGPELGSGSPELDPAE